MVLFIWVQNSLPLVLLWAGLVTSAFLCPQCLASGRSRPGVQVFLEFTVHWLNSLANMVPLAQGVGSGPVLG